MTPTRRHGLPFVQVSVEILRRPDISAQAKAVYCVLATYVDTTSRETFVGEKTLARDLGVSDRHIRTLVQQLRDAGVLVSTTRYRETTDGRKVRTTNLWVLDDVSECGPGTKVNPVKEGRS